MVHSINIYYVYILFDHGAIPRYVGKGKGYRWIQHEQKQDPNNSLKNIFIASTIKILGEIPKLKIRANLTEEEAFKIENALIAAIGRYPNGPLLNLTDKRNGPSSERMIKWHASRTPEERSASAKKSRATDRTTKTPEEISARHRRNSLAIGRDALSKRMTKMRALQTPEQRRTIGRIAGLASAASMTYEQKRNHGLRAVKIYMETTTPEQRRANAKKSGLAKLTKDQLSEYGKRGAKVVNSILTHAQRSAAAKKAFQTRKSKRKSNTQQSLFE